ncbi:type II toxin-antitoxin system RelE/ParE family toxin [Geothermobacter hydrogeniphilus]|uniref:type II toxin-antitoxin system RelE/ParE family toxin n=1 Tax=Geothermobacter hydrogeniphilus TaxID=1969733 RepID=UPI001FEB99DC|nr:type II toxin-antitoxin system RelE/ParE family toxin [Geothermobacter hydrogeniphilus]
MEKKVVWIGSALKDLRRFPEGVRQVFGAAIYYAQLGGKHPQATPMKGHKGAGVLEIVEDHDGDTYRCMYTVRYSNKVYVLHAFQKKSKKGIATPKSDLDVIKKRLKEVQMMEGI